MPNPSLPLVSVVMCVYNGARFLEQQVHSVLQQTYRNFELICVDDVSTDNSVALLKKFQQQDYRVKLYQNEVNLGFNRNFEKGIGLCTGEFISICDQDDIWLPTKLEELVQNIGDAALIYSNSELINEAGLSLNITLENKIVHVNKPTFKAFLDSNFITGHTSLFNKNLLPYVLPFPETINYYDKWIGMIAAYMGEVRYYPKILTQYRVHNTSVIQQQLSSPESKDIQRQKHTAELVSFSNLPFVKAEDKSFVEEFLSKKAKGPEGSLNYVACFLFLLKHHATLYPWYPKPFYKKVNFLRKQCLKKT